MYATHRVVSAIRLFAMWKDVLRPMSPVYGAFFFRIRPGIYAGLSMCHSKIPPPTSAARGGGWGWGRAHDGVWGVSGLPHPC